ncbi:uncharacterized protein LOC118502352 [Anopheles stephensi]|uniref:uncharacterized protein LOC118502352 n=1 Tax=Anopheles stephensi TaxID=30069 RepID=UPI0016588EB4|nr:uncharacterized protein LOC118502352 [Anopheles stephensi]XP_035890428.1 uncharacterized protein LOC118502352 [Anopheles stephensi]
MSSGGGKKKLVAAAASPLSVSIAANPVLPSQPPTGGIKLLIDKNRIVSVPSTKTQTIVVQRQQQQQQQQPSVVDQHNASLNQPPANEDNLRIVSSNVGSTTITLKAAPGTQKILFNKYTPIAGGAEPHGISGEMRVKVTGEDTSRNGQPMAATGGQLKQVKVTNSLLGRRMSIHRRLPPVPTTQDPDSNKGQQTVTLYTTTVKLSDEPSLSKPQITANNVLKSPQPAQPTVPTTAIISCVPATAIVGNLVPISSSSTQVWPASIAVDVSSATHPRMNQGQGTVSSINSTENGQDCSTATPPTALVKDQTDCVAVTSMQTAQAVLGDGVSQPAVSTETVEDANNQSKQPVQAIVVNVAKAPEESSSTSVDTVVLDEDVVSKPSREMKSLQVTQAKSKILSEFITDTISKGKLRKRRSDSIVDAAGVVGPVPSDTSPTSAELVVPPRTKRNRRRSTTLLIDAVAGHGKELATDESHKLEELANELPATRVRKIRSAKSEYALVKGDRNTETLSSGAKNFFSNLDLHHDTGKVDDESSFPRDPPKPGWDRFCWRCKQCDPDLGCNSCIRSYHKYCVRYTTEDPKWSCTECKMTSNGTTDIEAFTTCLGYLVKILLMQSDWSNLFNPINKSLMPNYDKYVTRHIDLAVMNELQQQRAYKSSEEFLTDVGWIVHNMSIYPDKTNLLKKARALQKRAKQEVEEMEPCYECYIKANTLCEDWFREPCSKPHLLVWAKMKGYPYWPGKLYVINANNQAFVRFFGAHDRSWMSVKECYLFSQRDPNPPKQYLKSKLVLLYATSVEDIAHHIVRLREQFNTFNYGSFMEAVDPSRFEEQQRAMFPGAFLKKVKVTIKRSEGEMVAVASAANEEGVQEPLKAKNNAVEAGKDATPVCKVPTKNVTSTSPRKRMTRRMSRFLKIADELTSSPLTNADSSQDLLTPSVASLLPITDKATENRQKCEEPDESKGTNAADDSDCDPKNLSLLLRRGSQSWETEPLSKRRKSLAEKGTLVSVAPKATKSVATSSKAKETCHKETVELVVDKAATPPTVPIDTSSLVSVAPVKAIEGKEMAVQKHAVVPVAEKTIIPPNVQPDKAIAVSVAPAKAKSTASTAKQTPQAIKAKDDVVPVAEKVAFISSNAVMEKNATPAATLCKIADTAATVGITNDGPHLPKQATTAGAQATHTLTTVANAAAVVSIAPVTTTTSTKPCVVDSLKNVASVDVTNSCTAAAASSSEQASKDTDAICTLSTTATSITVMAVKKEIISDDEANTVECPKDVMPVPIKELAQNDNSASLTASVSSVSSVSSASSASSVSSDVIKRQHITASVSSVNGVMPVQQTAPAVLPASSTTITMVTSNQRARKSFPGGASNTKHVSTRQAGSLVHNVSLPATITIPAATQQTVTIAPQQSLITPMNATVSIPKELVAPSTMVSLLPCTDDRKHVSNDVTMTSIANDNDDVLIIEEEVIPASVPSRGRKSDGSNQQLPPPLVPRPPETSISPPSVDDVSTVELNRTMQLFDDSSNRVLDHIRTVMEDLLKDMSGSGSSLAELVTLKLHQERQQELWQREKEKQQSAFDSRLSELRISLEQEKQRALNEQRQQLLREKQRAVQSTKLKQWCRKCFSEAHYYCCWNTSYCSAACQKKHWMEHQNDCTQEHANNARSVQSSSTVTASVLSADSNSSSTSITNSHMRNRLHISTTVPSVGGGGGDANSLLNKRTPNNRVFPGEITSTSTPLQTPVRFISSSLAGNVSYKTPIIQSVQGRDGMIINLPSHSPQNGGHAVTLGVNTSVTTNTPQQLMQKRAAARDKSMQLNHQKADSRNKGYTSRKTYDITTSPYSSANNLLTSTTSAIVPSAASSYATVTLSDAVTVSGASPSVWNHQMAVLQSSGSRQLHSGTQFVTVGGTSADGAEKGYSPAELGLRQIHSTAAAASLAQQQKMVHQQQSSAYMRHLQ